MKPIEARKQVILGPGRCFQLALSGMAFRMFRSSITVAILALAVAFLVHMLAYGILRQEVQQSAYDALGESRVLGRLLTRLAVPDPTPQVRAAFLAGDAERVSEYRAWSLEQGGTAETFDEGVDAADRLAAATDWLHSLPDQARAVLSSGLDDQAWLDRLREPAAFAQFRDRLDTLSIGTPPDGIESLQDTLTTGQATLDAVIAQARRGHAAAIVALRQRYDTESLADLFLDPPADLDEALRGAGFSLGDFSTEEIRTFARRQADLVTINSAITRPDVRAAIARETGTAVPDIRYDDVMHDLSGTSRGDWFAAELSKAGLQPTQGGQWEGERVLELARHYRRQQQLQAAVGDTFVPAAAGGESDLPFGLPERTLWLIVLSALVCIVGVANAMLMSVTERFSEIATMKCLGAMDGFVMMMFVIEATIQGLVGGLVGLVIGILLAGLRGFFEFGSLLLTAEAAMGDILLASALSLALGMLLATVAAVGPSFVAARLAPMEAMRVE